MWIEVGPAYGRDYKNQKEVLADWNAGKDFRYLGLFQNQYLNKEDAERLGLKVIVRYSHLTKTMQVKS